MSRTHIEDPMRRLRHDVAGCMNSLVLTAEVLTEDLDAESAVDFLDGLIRAADKLVGLLDQIEAQQTPVEQ